MFTSITNPSITDTSTDEQIPESSAPWVWIGFLFAGAMFIVEIYSVFMEWDDTSITRALTLIWIPGWIFWLVCIHRIHKILAELTSHRYPISPGEAAWKHIIPFYNFIWVFKWPAEISDYLNRRGRVKMISGYVVGGMLLLSLLLRFFDGAIAMAFLFGVTMFVSAKVKKHVKAVKGITPDQLPPLPDPRVFSRPLESPIATPAQTIPEGSEPLKSL
jgi:hypothetical protein